MGPDPHDDSEKILRRLHVSEHLANERTHLAYIRTGVSIIGLGIAINRFSLYLVQSQKVPAKPRWILEDAEYLGIGLAVLGILLLVLAIIRYGRTTRAIDAGDFRPNTVLVWILTVAVLVLGAASLAWLFQR